MDDENIPKSLGGMIPEVENLALNDDSKLQMQPAENIQAVQNGNHLALPDIIDDQGDLDVDEGFEGISDFMEAKSNSTKGHR